MKALPIGELTYPVSSWNPTREPGREFTYVDLSAVDNERKLITAPVSMLGQDAPSRARQLIKTGDVLVSTVRPNLNAVATVGPEVDGATASTGFTVLRPSDRLDARYLFHWVRTPEFISDMVRKATGASYPAVSDRIVKASLIPLPALAEQRRIATILDQADLLRTKRSEVLQLLDETAWSAFHDIFRSQAWPVKPLASVTDAIVDCPHSTPRWTEQGEVCIRTSNLTRGGWDWSDKRYVSHDDYITRSRRSEIELGDIILSREGTVGIAAIVEPGMRLCMGQRLVQVRADRSSLTPEYLLHYLLYALAPERISHAMVGSTARHLNVGDLRELATPVPPLELQKDFSQQFRGIRALQAQVLKAAEHDDTLAQSLQSRAFCRQFDAGAH